MHKLSVTLLDKRQLTAKEAEVLRYLCHGYTRSQIAVKLSRSHSTINRHVENIAYALECHSQAEIVAMAVALGMVEIKVVRNHSLLTRLVVCLLLAVNASTVSFTLRRGPSSPRPVRTARASRRTNRNGEQHPEDAFHATQFYWETA